MNHFFLQLHAATKRLWLLLGLCLWTSCSLLAATDQGKFDPVPGITETPAPAPTQPEAQPLPLAAQASNAPAPAADAVFTVSMDSLDDKHKLAIGDRLSFRILEDREDPEEPLDPKILVVTDSGELELPYLGRFPAESKTCKQLAREVKTALEIDYYYQATVIIAVDLMAKTRGKVYLVGPVRMPGPQEVPSDEVLTLSKAIMRAGGFTDVADRKNVKITRKGNAEEPDKKTIVVDVAEILDRGKIERDVPLEPGDLIMIPERLIRF